VIDRAAVKTVIRRVRRDTRLGDGPKVCFRCGYADPISLIAINANWLRSQGLSLPHTLQEDDHVVGRRHDIEFKVPICRNCHAEVTELRRVAGISMNFQPDQELREAQRLEALALFHTVTASALQRWASEKRTKKG
jgi:hypothetical protein